jgi:hypothetical protein
MDQSKKCSNHALMTLEAGTAAFLDFVGSFRVWRANSTPTRGKIMPFYQYVTV